MNPSLPADLTSSIQALLATGRYASEEDVLRHALRSLQQREDDLAAIREGLADMEAGRTRTVEEFDREFRQRHGINRPA